MTAAEALLGGMLAVPLAMLLACVSRGALLANWRASLAPTGGSGTVWASAQAVQHKCTTAFRLPNKLATTNRNRLPPCSAIDQANYHESKCAAHLSDRLDRDGWAQVCRQPDAGGAFAKVEAIAKPCPTGIESRKSPRARDCTAA